MGRTRIREPSPSYFDPRTSTSPPRSSEEPTSSYTTSASRPSTAMGSPPPTALSAQRLPTLSEILADSSPPPWTLGAFMAYLSQNHCLETLEFTMDAQRYRTSYQKVIVDKTSWIRDGNGHMCSLWEKLMQAYIVPYAPREVNLPAPVRDRLLHQPFSPSPPPPSVLEESVRIVYELMNDSVLVPFLESISPVQTDYGYDEEGFDSRQGRPRIRTSKDGPPRPDESSRSPKFLPALTGGFRSQGHSRSASSSADCVERDGLTDDSGSSNSPTATEPMTPPTTPPTSDWTFATSPGGLQRALTAHNNGWKKMGAKLGLGKKPKSTRRPNPTSAASFDNDVTMGDGDSIHPL